jgi:hypothetical protein
MLAFKDFVPKQLKAPHFGLSAEAQQGSYESLEVALAAANAWVREENVTLVNVETVVLPNLWANWEQGSADPVLGVGTTTPLWHQFIRVWYETCG